MTSPTKKPGAGTGVTSPLANLVARAATSLPAETGATAKAAWHRNRPEVRILLADISQSMSDRAGARTKIEILRQAIRPLIGYVRVVAFGSYPADIPPGGAIPEPFGSTALHLALDHIGAAQPTHVVVVSDGHPDDPDAALRAAARLGTEVQIDVIYCGPDGDREGMAFMRRLARCGGQVHRHSMAREPQRLAQTMRQLALPRS